MIAFAIIVGASAALNGAFLWRQPWLAIVAGFGFALGIYIQGKP